MDRPVHLDASTPEQSAAFAYAMRNALRRDPGIIRIGEATDPATMDEVTEAVRTGHLVSTIMHARKGN
ncbi:Toxin coregulated pilus biosynthesis protein T [compost metagenome]